jgi:hypothetical protein
MPIFGRLWPRGLAPVREWPLLLRRGLALGVLVALVGGAVSCRKGERVFVNAKVFALDPDPYLGVLVAVKGRVIREGPAQAWFEMEDDTGKLLVSSERLSARAGCRQGAAVAVEGVLRRVSGAEGLYFSMENLLHCRP